MGPRAPWKRAMKTKGRVEVKLHAFLTSALNGGEWVASHLGRFAPPLGRNPRYPLDMRLVGAQSRSGRGEEKQFLTPAGNRTPIVQPVVTELPRHCHTHTEQSLWVF
jgi:hypothetical protein